MKQCNINEYQLLEKSNIIDDIKKTLKPIQITKFIKLLEDLQKKLNDEEESVATLINSESNASIQELYNQYYYETWQLEQIINIIIDDDKEFKLSKIKKRLEQSKDFHQDRAKRILQLLQIKDKEHYSKRINNIKRNDNFKYLNNKFEHNKTKLNLNPNKIQYKSYNLRSINSNSRKNLQFCTPQYRYFSVLGLIIIILPILSYAIIVISNLMYKNQ